MRLTILFIILCTFNSLAQDHVIELIDSLSFENGVLQDSITILMQLQTDADRDLIHLRDSLGLFHTLVKSREQERKKLSTRCSFLTDKVFLLNKHIIQLQNDLLNLKDELNVETKRREYSESLMSHFTYLSPSFKNLNGKLVSYTPVHNLDGSLDKIKGNKVFSHVNYSIKYYRPIDSIYRRKIEGYIVVYNSKTKQYYSHSKNILTLKLENIEKGYLLYVADKKIGIELTIGLKKEHLDDYNYTFVTRNTFDENEIKLQNFCQAYSDNKFLLIYEKDYCKNCIQDFPVAKKTNKPRPRRTY